jgi:epoxide hydrolase
VAQLARVAEKFKEWERPAGEANMAAYRDRLLANVSLYWFTGTGSTAAGFLYEATHSGEWLALPAGWLTPKARSSIGLSSSAAATSKP